MPFLAKVQDIHMETPPKMWCHELLGFQSATGLVNVLAARCTEPASYLALDRRDAGSARQAGDPNSLQELQVEPNVGGMTSLV